MGVFQSNHTKSRALLTSILYCYCGDTSYQFQIYLTVETVTAMARIISSESWLRGTDLVILQHWLLNFGEASADLSMVFESFK